MGKYLVTGGAGFLGSHLIDRLVGAGHYVDCWDNLQTGSMSNVEHHLGKPNFSFERRDIVEPYSYSGDAIYNLACAASPIRYQADPIHTLKTSVWGVSNALESARVHGCRVFHASTSEVYGDPLRHPQDERYWGNVNPVGVRSCYDEGKRCAETLLVDYSRKYAVQIRVVRIFNTYGPRMSTVDGRVVSNFICQALRGEDITIYGDGSQTRSFCFVDDLIDGFIRMMELPCGSQPAEFWRLPLNLGNPLEFTVLELAQRVLSLVGGRSRLVFKELPSDDPVRRRPDISRAKNALDGWTPKVCLDDGLRETIRYFRRIV